MTTTSSTRAIAEVLVGHSAYDALTAQEQAVVRAEWAERIEARRSALDLAQEYIEQGRSYVELGDDGQVVSHPSAAEGLSDAT